MLNHAFDASAFLKGLTSRPGVYRMLDAEGKVLYVGKARNLKRRLSSYFRKSGLAPKTRALVNQIYEIETIVTHTENEALILENNLIKALQPRYNVLLKDDKNYPYVFLSSDDFPRLGFHRGAKRVPGQYFGPYPSIGSVRQTLRLLQEVFPVRQCEDSFYRNRSRPCLQYQIKRCTAPCVGLIDKESYHQDVQHAIMFLEGRDQQVIDELAARMEKASQQLAFEQAAFYRDRIGSLRRIQERQYISGKEMDIDVLGVAVRGGVACVEVFFIRGGRNLGNKTFLPKFQGNLTPRELLSAFIPQYYFNREIPPTLVLSHQPEDMELLAEVLSEQAGKKIMLLRPTRGSKIRWVKMALTNAEINLSRRLVKRTNITQRLESLQQLLGWTNLPQRIECFDISHTGGKATVASCVVFDKEGPCNTDYRRFNIEGITPGDDYAALRQALTRRYRRLKKGEGKLPDLLVIDGGKGQLAQAVTVLREMEIEEITVLGIAKGPERKAGKETLFLAGHDTPIIVAPDSPALHLLQHLRDEAHRFAVANHRQRRIKGHKISPLETIPGLGPKRRQKLLIQLGGLREVARAGVEELVRVPGISLDLAQRIYDSFHGRE
ncbi:excinuclease ABC subunit UvrC [Nitrosococcus wardiae]|uniref:UvrABC system protein C n=1 Tax=Nitrosococcus wardiae TaxID=1814290 RepID=A0A4P7C1A3_9GAMM|nr:excinuclease ABC subunit UvrC [Nitrosococcus wardiae]QBQ55387.1 excinuclease ABC subunit UvrC [Nitrosococcus wardiae]